MSEPKLKLFIYQTSEGERWLYAHFHRDNVWLTLEQITSLFDTTKEKVIMLLNDIYDGNHLEKSKVSKDISISTYKDLCGHHDGQVQKYYNLDAILAIGYQISVKKATDFREWAESKNRENLSYHLDHKVFMAYIYQLVTNFLLGILLILGSEPVSRFYGKYTGGMDSLIINLSTGLIFAGLALVMSIIGIAFNAHRFHKSSSLSKK